jgi:hypothetical protein
MAASAMATSALGRTLTSHIHVTSGWHRGCVQSLNICICSGHRADTRLRPYRWRFFMASYRWQFFIVCSHLNISISRWFTLTISRRTIVPTVWLKLLVHMQDAPRIMTVTLDVRTPDLIKVVGRLATPGGLVSGTKEVRFEFEAAVRTASVVFGAHGRGWSQCLRVPGHSINAVGGPARHCWRNQRY